MASQLQLVIYEGYLAEDPVMRFTPSGRAVANFRIGSNRQYKGTDGEIVKKTTWIKCTAWGNLGEIVNKLCAKGSHVIVTGKLEGNENGSPTVFEMKNGGHGASYELTLDEVRVLKGKDAGSDSGAGAPASEEDLPF